MDSTMISLAMPDVAEQVASYLLELGAVKLRPTEPFTWASGWKSPIYCDNRVTLSYPAVRSYLRESFFDLLKEQFPTANTVAGVATAGIPMGALLADEAVLSFVYVRSAPKGHGMENLIEGHLHADARVLVVEDLVSTGGSSLKAVEALRKAGAAVEGMVSVFNYGFPAADEAFSSAGVRLVSLSNYETLVRVALDKKIIAQEDLELLSAWRESPSTWRQ